MNTSNLVTDSALDDLSVEQRWVSLYLLLLPLVTRWVYSAQIYSWKGQENDIALDIVQVTILRMFEYELKMQSKNISIGSYHGLSIRIAKNYFQDLRRKDSRLLPLYRDGYSPVENSYHNELDVADKILDRVYEEWLLQKIANVIVNFPPKLRRAMFIDIANRLKKSMQPSFLRVAFAKLGIQLREYENQLPQDPKSRASHASLVSLGYKKIAALSQTQDFFENDPTTCNSAECLHHKE